jgi:hypothetical protein
VAPGNDGLVRQFADAHEHYFESGKGSSEGDADRLATEFVLPGGEERHMRRIFVPRGYLCIISGLTPHAGAKGHPEHASLRIHLYSELRERAGEEGGVNETYALSHLLRKPTPSFGSRIKVPPAVPPTPAPGPAIGTVVVDPPYVANPEASAGVFAPFLSVVAPAPETSSTSASPSSTSPRSAPALPGPEPMAEADVATNPPQVRAMV